MTRRRKIMLFIVLPALLLVGLILLPLILIIAQDIVGSFINRPFSHCEVMGKARLEEALRDGFDVNSACCSEHMMGECSIARANATPLVFAVENKNREAVELLLAHGADVNRTTESGNALAVAASLGRLDLVKPLLERGANHDSRSIALRMAAHAGEIEIAKLILAEPDPNSSGLCAELSCSLVTELDQIGNSRMQQQRDLLLHVIQTCGDPNVFCGPDRLLSALARKDEHAPLIEALLQRGADLNAREKNGKNVRDYLRSFWDYDSRPRIKALIESK